MQYAIALEMKYKRLRYSHSLAEAVHDSLVIMLRLSIKRRLISLSPSSELLVPSIFPLLTRRMLLPCRAQPPFVRHLGICNRIRVKFLQLMCAVITHNSAKELSLCINKLLSYSQL